MPSSPYFSSVTSESTFRARFQAEDGKSFRQLENVAASHWGRPHLFGCRVVRRDAQHNVLPILSQYTTPTDIHSAPDQIRMFLEGPDLPLMVQSEHYLVRGFKYSTSLAQIWAAMAMFKGSPNRRMQDTHGTEEIDHNEPEDDVKARHPKRARRHTIQPDFVESSGIQAGSSSPPHESSLYSPHGSSLGYVDLETHALGVSPEDDTLRLASCVLRHILYFASPQDSAWNPKVVEFRDAKKRIAASTPLEKRQIVAIDDDGLCLRQHVPDKGFVLLNNHIAVLEAKTQFQCIEDGRPMISDECFAQMICEGLASRLCNSAGNAQQR